ncbi:ABC-three component system protein [Clostridium tyrobutyricum]|uniref:ABC-three component system protein n=1 Tax=Clostridium tyrobutyricum TaxID=1519 RepID=UPI001C393CBC|nr:ABC-three component system protein [Clostridium tyrobutyricum]MBV4422782.1 hypothetical protein [Clostridium tyrobutyricum]
MSDGLQDENGIPMKNQISKDNSTINNIKNQNNTYVFPEDKVICFYEEDIKSIIIYFSKEIDNICNDISEDVDFMNIPLLEVKNCLNNLSNDYFEDIKEGHMQYFYKIDNFLKDPKNKQYLKMYMDTIAELKFKITSFRKDYDKFERIFIVLYDYTFNNHKDELRLDRNLIFVFLHFMYCNCDIGKKCKEEMIEE